MKTSVLFVMLLGCSGGDDSMMMDPGGTGGGADARTQAGTIDASAGTPAIDASSTTASCSMVGTWSGTVNGGMTQALWTMGSDGISHGSFTTNGAAVKFDGPWALSDGVLAFSSTSCTPSTACSCHGTGRYTIDFSTDCNTATAHYLSEECQGRQSIVDGLTLTRQ